MSKGKVEHNKGVIKDNALKALVRSNIFKHKVYTPKKGKASYSRKSKSKSNLDFFLFLSINSIKVKIIMKLKCDNQSKF